MNKVKIKDNPNLERDVNSNGILNIDDSAYRQHLANKQKQKLLEVQKRNAEERINNLENELKELKTGIAQILELLKHDKS